MLRHLVVILASWLSLYSIAQEQSPLQKEILAMLPELKLSGQIDEEGDIKIDASTIEKLEEQYDHLPSELYIMTSKMNEELVHLVSPAGIPFFSTWNNNDKEEVAPYISMVVNQMDLITKCYSHEKGMSFSYETARIEPGKFSINDLHYALLDFSHAVEIYTRISSSAGSQAKTTDKINYDDFTLKNPSSFVNSWTDLRETKEKESKELLDKADGALQKLGITAVQDNEGDLQFVQNNFACYVKPLTSRHLKVSFFHLFPMDEILLKQTYLYADIEAANRKFYCTSSIVRNKDLEVYFIVPTLNETTTSTLAQHFKTWFKYAKSHIQFLEEKIRKKIK
jgi:hypothetical protein